LTVPLLNRRLPLRLLLVGGLFLVLGFVFLCRIDCTCDKRYTLSEVSKSILKQIKAPVEMELYLEGKLNPGFALLQKATLDMIDDFNRVTDGNIHLRIINPYQSQDKDFISRLLANGVKGVSVNERNTEGRMTQHLLFP